MNERHVLKSWPKFFVPIREGRRRHELRRHDRAYCVGDVLELRDFEPGTQQYTGRTEVVRVTSITSAGEPCALSGEGLHPNFCILSIAAL